MAKHSTNKTLFSKKTIEFENGNDYVTISESEDNVISALNLGTEYTVESWISTTEIPEDPTFTYASDVASALKENSTLTLSGTVNVNDLYESDLLYAVKHDGTEITLKNKTSDKFPVNARILIIEMQALSSGTKSTVGNYEFAEVDSYISDDEIKLKNALTKTFDFSNRLYVVYQKRYNKIEIERDARIICNSWATNFNEINGLILLCADEIIVEGKIDANYRGFRGGNSGPHGNYHGGRGEGVVHGLYNNRAMGTNYTGGGGGGYKRSGGGDVGTGGGSGGNAVKGYNSNSFEGYYGRGGQRNNYPDGKLFLGGGGGQGAGDGAWPAESCSSRGGNGGRGGGIIILDAENTRISKFGSIVAKGQMGFSRDRRCSGEPGDGGAGAGGSILFLGNAINQNTGTSGLDSNVCAKGGEQRGSGHYYGPAGGLGICQVKGFHLGWMQGWMGHKFHNCSVIASFARPFGKTGDVDDYHTEKNRHAFLLTAIPFEDGYKLAAGQSHRMMPVSEKLEFDRFYHFVISRNSGSLEAIYIDGKRKGIRTWPSNHVYENSNIMLGANSDNDFENPAPFTGFIQDFRVAQNNMYDCTSYTLGDSSSVPTESCTDPTPSPSKSPSYSKSASASFEFPDGCPTRIVPYWGGTSGGGSRTGPSNVGNAFDGKDSTKTGWVSIWYSGSWKQDRFYFSDSNKQTPGTLRFYMQGGVNSGYGNRADMYIRYHEYGGPWVYLRNVTNSYMPRDQHFKYEVRVDSVARVDVYWKDRGKGSINYFYWYVDFEQDCYPICDNSIFHIQAKGNEPLKDRSTNEVPIEDGFEGYLPSLPKVPDGIDNPSILMDARFSNVTNLINNATLEGSYSIQGSTPCQQSVRFANSGGYAYFDNWDSKPQTLSFEIDFKINSHSNTATGGADAGSQYILHMQNEEEESNTNGLSLSYGESNKSLAMAVTSEPPSQPTAVTDADALVLGERVHVVVTISSDTIKIYVNGVESASETKDDGIVYHPTNKLTLGRANLLGSDFDRYMNGDIYNFRLWDDVVLNSSEVTELYELRNTKIETCDQAGIDLGQSSFAISEDKYILGNLSTTPRKLKVDEDFTIEFRVSIKDFEIAPSVSDLGTGNNTYDPVGNIVFAGAMGSQGIVGVGITKEKYFYTGFDGTQTNVLLTSSTPIPSSSNIFKLRSIKERSTTSSGATTNYLNTSSDLYNNLVDAFNFWNDTVAYPDSWIEYKGSAQQIEMDIYVEDWGEINDDLPSNAQSAMSENTVARAAFMSASGPKSGGEFSFGSIFPEDGFIRINRKFIDEGHFDDIHDGHSDMYYTIRHELAHILGINSTFFNKSVIADAPIGSYVEGGKTKYYYTGKNGLDAYKNAITDDGVRSGIVGIPIEDDGGSSSAGGHWEEGDSADRFINGKLHPGLDTETLTPIHDDEDVLSAITLNVLKDLGYQVDLSKAEPYKIGSGSLPLQSSSSKFMIDETQRSLNTTYSVALNYRSNVLTLFINGYAVKQSVVIFNDDSHMDGIVVGANDALDYFSSNINIQDVRIVQESLYDREYYKPRNFLTDACENVKTPTPTPTLTYVGRTITIAEVKVDDDSEMNNVFARVFVNDTGPNPDSSDDYWGYSVNGGPVLRVYEGFTVDFTYLVDGTHTFKAYYFVADGTQTIVTDTSEFTIKSPELNEKCNRYQVERTKNLLRSIDIIGKCSIVVTPNYFKYESTGLSVQTANIVVNDTNGDQYVDSEYTFRNIIEVTSNTASKNTVLIIDSGEANAGNLSNLSKTIKIHAFGETTDVNGWTGDNIDIITTDISNKNYLTSNNSRTFVNPGDCEHASHYTVDLSHTDVTLNSTPRSALSYLNMLSSDMISDELEIHTIDKSNYKLVPLYSSEDIIDSKLLSQSRPPVGLLPNIVLELDNVGGDSANINETNDQPNRIFISTLNKHNKKSSLIVNSAKIIVNNNETN